MRQTRSSRLFRPSPYRARSRYLLFPSCFEESSTRFVLMRCCRTGKSRNSMTTMNSAMISPETFCGGISKVNFQETLSSFGDKCPQNGSKNGLRAPRTGMGCPHIGPSVDDSSDHPHLGPAAGVSSCLLALRSLRPDFF